MLDFLLTICYNTLKREKERLTMVCYDRLWKLLIDKKMNRTELKNKSDISFNVLAKMGRNEFVSLESLYKICNTLDCDISEIMEFRRNEAT